jgi:hypothetical protein
MADLDTTAHGGPATEPATTYETANLLYFFWLPGGKDEFGFRYDETPLRDTTFYRDEFERTIANHLRDQEKRLRGNQGSIAGLSWRGSIEPQDAELGLRKIQYSFEYEPDRTLLPSFFPAEPLSGTAIILSNGLYLWSFKVKYARGTDEEQVRSSLMTFLKEDFVQRHVDRMLGFGWPDDDNLDEAQPRYDGILTYYQLDLLFNCVFDAEAHPHLFLHGDGLKDNAPSESEMYNIGAIVQSLSLCGFKKHYDPLWDLRKSYSFRGAGSAGDDVFLDTDVDLYTPQERFDEERERLLSRLSFAAMEQFLRIAVPFGVTHYKAGLDHCRSELVNYSLLARRNHASTELRRPSLKGAAITLSEVAAYHALLAGKVPSLEFVHGLVEGLTVVSEPLQAPNGTGARGSWIEWADGRSTLAEALDVFKRYVEVIKTELAFIDRSLSVTQADNMLSELSDTRKLAEMETEDPHRTVVIEGKEWDALSFRLGVLAIILGSALGFVEIYSTLGVQLTENLFSEGSSVWEKIVGVAHWPLVLALAIVLLVFVYRRYMGPGAEPADDPATAKKQVQTHIFDYSFMREVITSRGLSEGVVEKLRGTMIDLQKSESERLPAVSFSTIREMPPTGIERIKYSLESDANEAGVSYLLHIEVDRRPAMSGTTSDSSRHTELLRNVRLVARVPKRADLEVAQIAQGARDVIGNCVRDLVLAGKSDHEVHNFFESHFGWDWP